jgi:hypothetical protein
VTLSLDCLNLYRIAPNTTKSDGKMLVHLSSTKIYGAPVQIEVLKCYDADRDCCCDHLLLALEPLTLTLLRLDTISLTFEVVWLGDIASAAGAQISLEESSEEALGLPADGEEGRDTYSAVSGAIRHLRACLSQDIMCVTTMHHIVVSRVVSAADTVGATMSSFAIALSTLSIPGNVIDTCFVQGTSSPALAVLYDEGTLPTGHVFKRRNTCGLLVCTIDSVTAKAVVIWRREALPHDCSRVLPADAPIGPTRLLLITTNAVLVCSEVGPIQGVATNAFATLTAPSATKAATQSADSRTTRIVLQPASSDLHSGVELNDSCWLQRTPTDLLGFLLSGEVVQLSLEAETLADDLFTAPAAAAPCIDKQGGSWAPSALPLCMRLRVVGHCATPAHLTISRDSQMAFYCGFRAPSVLLRLSSSAPVTTLQAPAATQASTILDAVAEAEEQLYDSALVPTRAAGADAATHTSRPLHLEVLDSVVSVGPVLHAAFSSSTDLPFDCLDSLGIAKPRTRPATLAAASYIPARDTKESLEVRNHFISFHSISSFIHFFFFFSPFFPSALRRAQRRRLSTSSESWFPSHQSSCP